ncbi:hypothetical protein [Niveibacterium sp. SC-1]|uniref:hypothetical protein n=1 Tax=Niveibacterium sp. SC-1 TaxID=3135646 RepID=UPI00311F838D
MRLERLLFVCGLIAVFPPTWAQAQTTGKSYCCTDASGLRICGDPLPAQCYNRAYREISKSGRTTNEVEAPLTPEERIKREQAAKLQREAEARMAERRRRDKVLVESYASVKDIDERRDTALGAAQKEIENLRRRERELLKEREDLDGKVAALKGRTAPKQLQEDMAANASELDALRAVIAQKQREADSIRGRFEEDRNRYIELTKDQPHN